MHTDFVAQASLLTVPQPERMRQRGSGTLVAFSMVAGCGCGLASYVYGSARLGWTGSPPGSPMPCTAPACG